MDNDFEGKTPTVLDEAMNLLLNEIIILCFIKLKEYKNARAISQECILNLSKSNDLGFIG